MPADQASSRWKQFWDRGGWWKALIAAAVYYGLYQLASLGLIPIVRPLLGSSTSVASILLAVALPIAIGCVILVLFVASVGWLRELFARQPIRGGKWMWIAVGVVLLFNILRFAATDYGKAGFGFVAAWLFAALFIGFAEEVLTRGIVVNLMRRAGHPEIAVGLVSAAIFAGLHAGNLLTGQALFPTLVQLVYTFCFGICMYLSLRITGNLLWPILLHASTDPSIFIMTTYPSASPIAGLAGLGNIVVIAFGLIAIIFIRGRVGRPAYDPPLRGASLA